MGDSFEEDGLVRLGVSAALSQEYQRDQREFFRLLAESLERTMPDLVEIKRAGYFSGKHVQKIVVTMANDQLILEDTGRGPLIAEHAKVVRGIAISHDSIPVDEALQTILQWIEDRAAKDSQARAALAQLLGLS